MKIEKEDFNLGIFKTRPPIDELPVSKINFFPFSENINENILAQARLFYIINEGLYLRLWAFMPDSNDHDGELGFFLRSGERNFSLCFNRLGSSLKINKKIADLKEQSDISLDYFKGEDLEGWYWGAEVFIKEKYYKKNISNNLPEIGDQIYGNLFSNIYTEGRHFKKELGRFNFVDW